VCVWARILVWVRLAVRQLCCPHFARQKSPLCWSIFGLDRSAIIFFSSFCCCCCYFVITKTPLQKCEKEKKSRGITYTICGFQVASCALTFDWRNFCAWYSLEFLVFPHLTVLVSGAHYTPTTPALIHAHTPPMWASHFWKTFKFISYVLFHQEFRELSLATELNGICGSAEPTLYRLYSAWLTRFAWLACLC